MERRKKAGGGKADEVMEHLLKMCRWGRGRQAPGPSRGRGRSRAVPAEARPGPATHGSRRGRT